MRGTAGWPARPRVLDGAFVMAEQGTLQVWVPDKTEVWVRAARVPDEVSRAVAALGLRPDTKDGTHIQNPGLATPGATPLFSSPP